MKRNENTRISEIFKPQYDIKPVVKKNDKKDNKEIKKNDDENGMDYLTFIRREKMDENQLIAYYKKTRRNVCLKLKEIDNFSNLKEIINKKNKTKKDKKKNHKVRLKLQTSNSFYKKNINQPNNLESENFYESNNLKDMEAEYKTLTKGLHSRPIKTAQTSKTRIFSKINNFQEEEEESEKEKDIANKWKKYENLSPEQIQRKEFLESKKKWIAKEDFHRHFGARSTSIKPIANIMIYGMPVSSHKYRDINPSKWITPNGFI